MSSRAYGKKSFSIMVGGGDRGTDIGIGLFIMIPVGASTEEFHFGIAGYLMVGGRIIETIFGEGIHGIIIISPMPIFKEIGRPGIRRTIGIGRNIGNSHIIMMGGRTVFVDLIRVILIKDVVRFTLTRDRIEVSLTKIPHREI